MGVGVGVVMLVVGAIIYFALEADIPFLENDTLGVILMAVGALAIVLALVMNKQHSQSKHVQRNDGPPRS